MNRCLLPLLTLAFAALAPAQSFTLLLRHGPGDLVLNAPLVEALAAEPEVGANLQKLLGDDLQQVVAVHLGMPAAHLPGTFQIQGLIELQTKRTPDPATRQKVVDCVVEHLVRRLTFLLVEEPAADLADRSAELRNRITELTVQQATLQADSKQLQTAATAAQLALAEANAKLRELQVRTGTVGIEVQQLEQLRGDLHRQHEKLQSGRGELQAERTKLQRDVEELQQRVARGGDPAMVDQLQAMNRRAADLDNLQDDLNAKMADVRASLDTVLARIPEAVLMDVRLRTEVQVGEALAKQLTEQADRSAQQLRESFRQQAELQRVDIDLEVTRQLLAETQGKLARLRRLHVELIRN